MRKVLKIKELPMRRLLDTAVFLRFSVRRLAVVIAASLLATADLPADVDPTINRDVWKLLYGVTDAQLADSQWLNSDTDADGLINAQESAAGTDPFNASSVVKLLNFTRDESGYHLTFPTVPYKLYVLQSATNMVGPQGFADVPAVSVIGDGGQKTLSTLGSGGASFFRVQVRDGDNDNDQVSNWAEQIIGYNPNAAQSNGITDDLEAVADALAVENVVSITATDSTALQPPDAGTAPIDVGQVTVSRSGTLRFTAITVPLAKAGTALEGVDYADLPDTVTIPVNSGSVVLDVMPLANTSLQTNRTATVTPMAGTGYTLAPPSNASVVINPSGNPIGTGLTGTYWVGSNSTYTSPVNFGGSTVGYAYTKTNDTTGSAVVTYSATSLTTGLRFSTTAPNNRVNLQFATGNLFGAGKDRIYTITAATGTTFTVAITGTGLPESGSGNCILNPSVLTRQEGNLDNVWLYGTPNGVFLVGSDNYSASWEGYLAPSTTGNYTFQLIANDKARVFLDLNADNVLDQSEQILENGWDTSPTTTFKQSAAYSLTAPATPANRYRMKVEFVETTGAAACRFQWRLNTGAFANIPNGNVFRNNSTTTTGWNATYYNNTTLTPPAAGTQFDAAITTNNNGDWGIGTPDPSILQDNFVARWTGQVQPEFSETYYFSVGVDDGIRVRVNNQLIIDRWTGSVTQGAINLQAGVLYDIMVEYYELTGAATAQLSWYSQSQPKQIIPTSRLYPHSSAVNPGGAAPPAITSPLYAVAFVGQPFTYTITASNSGGTPTTYAATGAFPAGFAANPVNSSTGVISGTPTQAGKYQLIVSATSASGTGSSVLNLEIFDTGNRITREVYAGLGGDGTGLIPESGPSQAPDEVLTLLEDAADYDDNTGKRLRGYITAPQTGNYYFWISASNAAELWISNDDEPVNKVRRAYVAGSTGTALRTWNAQASQKSSWLALQAGQRYYFEVLHNTGAVVDDHVSVGYALDPTGNSPSIANGSGVVPGHLLSPYDYPATAVATGTLYATNLAPQGVAVTKASGSARLRLNQAKTQAVLHFHYSGLGSPRTAYHIHADALDATHPQGEIILDLDDIDTFHPELITEDGGYIWDITASGTLSAAQIIQVIESGKAYLNVHSVNYPAGEIRGNFSLVDGSQSPPVYVPSPAFTNDSATDAGAARFLHQAAFGAHPTDVAYVKANGFEAWIDNQFTLPSTLLVPEVLANVSTDINQPYPSSTTFNAWWKRAVTANDQLRQKMALALTEILVVSDVGPLNTNGRILADYYDVMLDNAFANFRTLLKQVTLTPAMGIYLDMRGNQSADLTIGRHPNENYAREILQLFSVGLYRMWPDGRLVLDSDGNLVPTYGQPEILGFSRAFTGWNYGQQNQANGRLPTNFGPSANYLDPMVLVPTKHELGAKLLLDNVVLRPAVGYNYPFTATPGTEADFAPATSPVAFDTYCLNDLEQAMDNILNNANVGPFICRQLIQRFTTSHPSPQYLHRVVRKFNDNGSGQRGDFKAVLKAILLDGEARDTTAALASTKFGKQREPIVRLASLGRTFPTAGTTGTFSQPAATTTTANQIIIDTATPHDLSASSTVFLDFTSNLTQTSPPSPLSNPTTTNYTVASVQSTTRFTVNSTGLHYASGNVSPSYTQTAGSNLITITNVGGPAAGGKCFLKFLTGDAPSGIYTVQSNPSGSSFTALPDADPAPTPPVSARSGRVLIPRYGASYNVNTTGTAPNRITTITLNTIGNHHLAVGNKIWFDAVVAVNGVSDNEYTISQVTDEDHVKIVINPVTEPAPSNQSQNSNVVWPLVEPPLQRAGNVRFEASTFAIGYTGGDLTQTVLNSPTVFNFYFPDYKYPGSLAANNVTTPEFQLTTDTNIVTLTNTLASAIASNSNGNGNTNGLCSYSNGNGRITMDFGEYHTAAWTANASIPALVNRISELLTGGTVSQATKDLIVPFVANNTNFPYTTPTPTPTQMRDRVRAVVHLIVTSAEFAVQR
ncbi:hypothetical protein AYO49_00945 [Verrucomicrobiaceae bacterium SCGC AG-212-N21]|nr:hypothetical protein AYO49_00945 [Verrucomicrobiaceae bacterium SCGC AG-212-N21]